MIQSPLFSTYFQYSLVTKILGSHSQRSKFTFAEPIVRMLGWIYASEHPYYAVTKKDGTFSISDVPPGSYTLVAWQEYTDATEVPVTVKAKEATQQTIELKKK